MLTFSPQARKDRSKKKRAELVQEASAMLFFLFLFLFLFYFFRNDLSSVAPCKVRELFCGWDKLKFLVLYQQKRSMRDGGKAKEKSSQMTLNKKQQHLSSRNVYSSVSLTHISAPLLRIFREEHSDPWQGLSIAQTEVRGSPVPPSTKISR